jgi:hypothetical protein
MNLFSLHKQFCDFPFFRVKAALYPKISLDTSHFRLLLQQCTWKGTMTFHVSICSSPFYVELIPTRFCSLIFTWQIQRSTLSLRQWFYFFKYFLNLTSRALFSPTYPFNSLAVLSGLLSWILLTLSTSRCWHVQGWDLTQLTDSCIILQMISFIQWL